MINEHAGFTTAIPWLKVNPNYKEINVEKAMVEEAEEQLLIILNYSPIEKELSCRQLALSEKELLISNFSSTADKVEKLVMCPYEARIYRMK